jgi:hypothetical protein
MHIEAVEHGLLVLNQAVLSSTLVGDNEKPAPEYLP